MKKFDFAFIVHSRGRSDIFRKYPVFKIFPNRLIDVLTRRLPPLFISQISGLKNQNGMEMTGMVIGIPMTARQLLEEREAGVKKIIQAVKYAKSNGVKYVGLGAMTASLTRGGKDVIEHIENVYVTTGRTYTAKNIVDYIEYFVERYRLNQNTIRIGIVGAAGGIGSSTAIILARKKYKHFILVDLERKLSNLKKNIEILENHASNLTVEISHQVSSISECDIIVAATSAPEIVIKSQDVSPGTIIINDAQPSDVSPEIINLRKDVLVIEGGVLHSKNINCHFNLGLFHKNDIFSCLAETLLLTYLNSNNHYSIDFFDNELLIKLEDVKDDLGFNICPQNDDGFIDEKKMEEFGTIIRNKRL